MTIHIPEIAADIKKAHTLPGSWYQNPALFEESKEKIFARSWQLIGDSTLVKTPGDVHPFTLLPGCLDEPLLLTRDAQDSIHCLSNVCTHRGNLVAEHPGHCKQLRCRYHGRKFALDGKFVSMPEFSEVENFPCESDDLSKVSCETFKQFLFASLNPRFKLSDALSDIENRLSWYPFDQLVYDQSLSRDYLVQANWMLYCDNYLEGFHIPFVHHSLAGALEYGDYRTECFEWSNLQLGISKGSESLLAIPPSSPDAGLRVAAYYYWIFPNLMLNFYPWGLSINVVKPIAVDRTRVSFLAYVADSSKLDHGAGAELDRVEREDEEVVECVQRGIRSRYYSRGRYSPSREQGVHHFHRLLVESYV